ncbi:hypothetical protein AVEN_273678-1 [Araneus ventricosus]|uniref:Uncharacterized protein n=1 Tax=Araneus ventricosus TaxID=182803 RepID=A0A4Y2MPM1_ARAVE|nr:hypothetical protein AVEN_273678-1 [Araneus ventricosus]
MPSYRKLGSNANFMPFPKISSTLLRKLDFLAPSRFKDIWIDRGQDNRWISGVATGGKGSIYTPSASFSGTMESKHYCISAISETKYDEGATKYLNTED